MHHGGVKRFVCVVRYCCRGLWNGKPRRGAKGGSSRRMVMGNHGDPWFALDKAEHFVACFAITVAAATVLGFVRKELRGWLRLALGSLLGLTAGALKEVGDATHLLPSDGASIKDGVADVLGVSSIVVYVTVPNKETGSKLAHSIIENKLAACVNQIPGVESTYWWQGKVETDSELLLMIKTRQSLLQQLTDHVTANHPYDTPEVIAVPITGGSHKYLQWLAESTQKVLDA
ncbi:unnamed protein product [Sphagnum jensenii]